MTSTVAEEPVVSTSELKSRAQRRKLISRLPAVIGTLPMTIVAIGVFVIGIAFTMALSFTNTKFFLINVEWVGLRQYDILWQTPRWLQSVANIWFYGFGHIALCMGIGFVLAVFMDQRIRGEDAFRTIFLYPFALSAVITGLVWNLMLDPIWGLQAAVRSWGFPDFVFAPLADSNTALFGMVVASVWNGVGVTMAILLAGLRGVDEEIWKAARIDGIPTWRTYLSIVVPTMRGAVATALVLLIVNVVRTFDIVIAMTGGGPGISTQMPATYVIDSINSRNVALGVAAATCMLVPIAALIIIQAVFRWRAARRTSTT
ncbi:MAG: carbohydrate ABC transporter permease [Devosia sp.]